MGEGGNVVLITRQVFWSWSEMRRDSWSHWFETHGFSLGDIVEFAIDEEATQIEARVYLKDDDGRRYLDGDEVASETVALPVEVLKVGLRFDRPGLRHLRLDLPPYK